MNLFQIIFAPLCCLFAVASLRRAWRGKTSRRQGLGRAALCLAGAALIVWPRSTMTVAGWLGIGRGADLVFYLAILCGMYVCLRLYEQNRRLENLVTDLVRREALRHPQRGTALAEDRHSLG